MHMNPRRMQHVRLREPSLILQALSRIPASSVTDRVPYSAHVLDASRFLSRLVQADLASQGQFTNLDSSQLKIIPTARLQFPTRIAAAKYSEYS